MTTGYQRAQQQKSRIADMTPLEARKEWKLNRDTYNPELPEDELIYRCFVQDMLFERSFDRVDE